MNRIVNKQEALYRTMHNANKSYRTYNHGVRRMRDWLLDLDAPPATVLEVGCGNRMLCEALSLMGYAVTGLDIVQGCYDIHNHYDFIKHNLQTDSLPFDDDQFDYCVSFDCIEHLEVKWAMNLIREMDRVARKSIIGTAACFGRDVLHQTIREKEWWIQMIDMEYSKEMSYHVFSGESVEETLLFKTKREL